MDETMAVEQANTILNEAEWRGRNDWKVFPRASGGPKLVSNSHDGQRSLNRAYYDIYGEDAIAIAQGVLDRKRIVELETNLKMKCEHLSGVGKAWIKAEKELTMLRLAVEPVARLANDYDSTSAAIWLDGYTVTGRPGETAVTVGDLRTIRALLATEQKGRE